MSRIGDTFAGLRKRGRKGLVAFVTAGDPSLERTAEIALEMEKGGVDVLELGVPFSDPLADGPVIQRASERALRAGVTLAGVVRLVRNVRRRSALPIVLFSYFNPLLRFGLERLAGAAAEAGVDGVLVTDLPPEEAKKAKVGNGLDPATELGPVQNKMQYDKVVGIIKDTKKAGAKFLAGGEIPAGPG